MPRSLSPQALSLLTILLSKGPRWSHGYELAQAANLKSGTLYPLLIRLEQGGWLEAEWQPPSQPGKPPRHAYRLTLSGVRLARDNQPASPALPLIQPVTDVP
jgi:PadR family transcriptional regulator, regulatory protein PadR